MRVCPRARIADVRLFVQRVRQNLTTTVSSSPTIRATVISSAKPSNNASAAKSGWHAARFLLGLTLCACAAAPAKPGPKPGPELPEVCTTEGPRACFIAGLGLEFAVGAERDVETAVAAYEQACVDGFIEACGYLGSNLVRPNRPPETVTVGERFYEQACAEGLGYACVAFGVKVARGFGVERDAERAHQLLSKGCSLGNNDGCILAETVAESSADQVPLAVETYSLPSASGKEVNATLAQWPAVATECFPDSAPRESYFIRWIVVYVNVVEVEASSTGPLSDELRDCLERKARAMKFPATCEYCAYAAEAALTGSSPTLRGAAKRDATRN